MQSGITVCYDVSWSPCTMAFHRDPFNFPLLSSLFCTSYPYYYAQLYYRNNGADVFKIFYYVCARITVSHNDIFNCIKT